ncbi:unnamed protein product [Rotaria sp. Silwood2]|nr:unnamed protein product [Rotaria sp. Silwood2]CAF2879029.1 unnamed protein product [Rotaria sp. Silwood2]CAF4006869.1 unnamed protein product [Rotaria sp. Silwood2]CAF4322385.1 unnamed protein product [Rotaria sp. Silwood2]
MEQYLMLPRTYEGFFELNLNIISPVYTHMVTYETGQSYEEILIAAPNNDIVLSASLCDESKTSIEGGDFVYFDRDRNLWRCHFAPQKVGNHTILVFGGKKDDSKRFTSNCTVEFTFDIDHLPATPISYPLTWSHFFDYQLEIIKPVNTRFIDWPPDKNSPYCEILVRSPDDIHVSAKIADSLSSKTIENGHLINFNNQESLWQCLFAPSMNYSSYKLTLFAKRFNENQSNCVVQFDFKQLSKSTLQNYMSFPITYASFNEAKCQLFEPLDGILKRGSKIKFRCRIPGAHVVSITVDGQWLKDDSASGMNENHLFQREIQVGQKEVAIWVKFDKEKSNYKGLLKYSVK